jgi:protein-S-isoprenylcysteine O-methyltransferase Ste14
MTGGTPSAFDLRTIQRQRKRLLLGMFGAALLPALSISSCWWPSAKALHRTIEWAGIVLIFVCIFGRTWCTLYIGARKKRMLVRLGPYSLSRNPLYAFTVLGAFGVGAQYGSLIMATCVAAATFAVFYRVARREEAFLAGAFGADFVRYAEEVPLFGPRLSGWRDTKELTVNPRLVLRTFLHATVFLLTIPAAEVLEGLQRQGTIPVLLRLP